MTDTMTTEQRLAEARDVATAAREERAQLAEEASGAEARLQRARHLAEGPDDLTNITLAEGLAETARRRLELAKDAVARADREVKAANARLIEDQVAEGRARHEELMVEVRTTAEAFCEAVRTVELHASQVLQKVGRGRLPVGIGGSKLDWPRRLRRDVITWLNGLNGSKF